MPRPPSPPLPRTAAFTILELALVVFVAALVALVAAPRFSDFRERARATAALQTARALRDGFVGSDASGAGLLADWEGVPGFEPAFLRVRNLLVPTGLVVRGQAELLPPDAPGAAAPPAGCAPFGVFASRWRGPYVAAPTAAFPAPDARARPGEATWFARGFYPSLAAARSGWSDEAARLVPTNLSGRAGDPAVLDPWGAPFVLQVPPPEAWRDAGAVPDAERWRWARLVSAGPDGRIDAPLFPSEGRAEWAGLDAAAIRRDIRLAGRPADDAPGGARGTRGDDLVLFLFRNDLHDESGDN